MSILVDNNTRLLVQGITGSSGAFHAKGCMEYGTNVVAGVTPGKGGQLFEGKVPVFDTVCDAREKTACNATMIFVPAPFAADAILEALSRIGRRMDDVREAFAGVSDLDDDASDELHRARHALKRALRSKHGSDATEARRIAKILDRAAAEILKP